MKNPTRRIYYYDFIRAFAIFGVLACHCFAGSVVNVDLFNTRFWYYSLFLNSLRLVSVPLFIVVSGALLIGKKDSIRVFIKKRFNKVIIPYIFWVIMYILFLIFYRHFNVGKAVFSTISIPPTAGVFFWFVQMIIVVYLIILILNKLIEYNKSFLGLSLILSILFVVLINFNLIPSYPKPHNYVYYIIFAIFGVYLSSYDFKNNKLAKTLRLTNGKLTIIFFLILIASYLLEVYINASMSLSLNKYSPISQFSLLNICLVISTFLFFRYLFESKFKSKNISKSLINSSIGKIILSISFCSYGIYLCHIIIRNLIKILLKNISLSQSVFLTILLILDLIISWLVILSMSKIPILKKVSGV